MFFTYDYLPRVSIQGWQTAHASNLGSVLNVVKFYCENSFLRPKDVFWVKAEGSNEQRAFGDLSIY